MKSLLGLKVAVSVGSVSMLAFVFVQACGGDDSNTSDSGLDGTTSDVAADNATSDATGDVKTDSPTQTDGGMCPTYTGSQALCKAIVARCGTCGASVVNLTACEIANFTAVCDHEATAVSQAVGVAETACEAICDSTQFSNCGNGSLADASLTTAQTKVETDYCARCGGSSPACLAAIEKTINVRELSDSVVGQIDALCTPDASAAFDSGTCQNSYTFCALAVFENALSGGPCSDAGGGG